MPKLLIAHGGAPTAVLNASLCGAVEAARTSGRVDGVLGARGGTRGILDGSFANLGALDAQALARIAGAPGSCIGTSRTPLAPEDYPRMAQSLAQAGVGYALLTGGTVHHGGASVGKVFAHTRPQSFAHAAANLPYINAGVDLTQPFGEIAAQARRAVGHGDDDDGPSPSSASK